MAIIISTASSSLTLTTFRLWCLYFYVFKISGAPILIMLADKVWE